MVPQRAFPGVFQNKAAPKPLCLVWANAPTQNPAGPSPSTKAFSSPALQAGPAFSASLTIRVNLFPMKPSYQRKLESFSSEMPKVHR
jgi:hypothetical protein